MYMVKGKDSMIILMPMAIPLSQIFVENTILSLAALPWHSCKNILTINIRVYFGFSVIFYWSISVCIFYVSPTKSLLLKTCSQF